MTTEVRETDCDFVVSLNDDGCYGTDEQPPSLHQAQLLERVAREWLAPWGIDFSGYSTAEVGINPTGVTANVTWTHRDTGAELCLAKIFWVRETGEILQAGVNSGRLTL